MADFLRIGDRVINLNLVTDMRIQERQITIYLAAPAGSSNQPHARSISFKDDEAAILQAWIARNTVDAGSVIADVVPHEEPRQSNSAVGAFGR